MPPGDPEKQTPGMPQSPSVAHGVCVNAQCPCTVVVVVDVVVVVLGVQHRFSAAASSCVSPGLHASRTLTPLLKVLSRFDLAQSTAASAAPATSRAETTSRTTIGIPSKRRRVQKFDGAVN